VRKEGVAGEEGGRQQKFFSIDVLIEDNLKSWKISK
jgi:hypothetical protein